MDGAAESIPVADGTATIVWSIATVHHWPHLEEGIADPARRVPGGTCIKVYERDFCNFRGESPGEHDRLLADVSHLPHLLAAALVSIQEERAIGIAGQGFKDSTRIAAGDAAMWRDIFLDNREGVIRSLDRFMAGLKDYRTALQAGDGQRIEALLAAARERRKKI